MTRFSPTHQKHQQGSVLLIGMIFLAILMIGAISTMNSAVQDERISGNTKTSVEAFFAAEAGYRELVDHLLATDQGGDKGVAKGRWDSIDDQISSYDTPNGWKQANIDNKVSGFDRKAFGGQGNSAFTVKFSPVFDEDGNRVENKILFFSEGTVGRASRTIGFELEGGGGGPLPPAPAAISCFGAGCNIDPGNASNAAISGRNHPTPEENCGGKGGSNCWTDPYTNGINIPSVFLEDRSKSHLIGANGSKKNAYHGQDKTKAGYDDANNQPPAFGNDKNANSVWAPGDYPEDTDGNSTAPTYEQFFGANSLLNPIFESANQSPTPDGIFVLDTAIDTSIPMSGKSESGVIIIDGQGNNAIGASSGTGFFAGLIILKGCNQISVNGNFTVYGAIIVDATDGSGNSCGTPDSPYSPFIGGGTIDVKYSLEALESAGSGTGGGFNGTATDWYEVTGG